MKTREIKVANVAFLINKIGQECTDWQYLRELVQNAIDAINRTRVMQPDFQGRIVVDFARDYSDMYGAPKLSVTDNGDGMDANALEQHMNTLSKSGSTQALDGNFGVGARVATLSRNPVGVVIESWRAGEGNVVHMWCDPQSGDYGLKPLSDPNGEEAYVLPLADDSAPDFVEKSGHGTRVVLLGKLDDENTCVAPRGISGLSEWLVKTLNRRYFSLPPGITISARTSPAKGLDNSTCPTRLVHGAGHALNAVARARGVVSIEGAAVHWWILPSEQDDEAWVSTNNTKAGWSRSYDVSGHVAALSGSEIYGHRYGPTGRYALQSFGITAGTNQVVLYVEPTRAAVNLARTALTDNGEELPWSAWGTAFQKVLPRELADFVSSQHEKADGTANDDISKRLLGVIGLYAPPRFRPSPVGTETMDEDAITIGGSGMDFIPPPVRNTEPRPFREPKDRSSTGARGKSLSGRTKPLGPSSIRTTPALVPKVEWADLSSELGDVAAEFLPASNIIRANKSFRLFGQIEDLFADEFGDTRAVRAETRRAIESWFGTQLTETVMGVQALLSNRGGVWSQDMVDTMLKPEALTVAACVRYLAINQIRNTLSKRFERSAATTATEAN